VKWLSSRIAAYSENWPHYHNAALLDKGCAI